jgi:hypothetical protein
MLTIAVALVLSGCGLSVQSPDLFQLTRQGQGTKLTMLVNDSGTIRCDGGQAKPLADKLLLQARDLAGSLDTDAKSGLKLPTPPGTIYSYTVKLKSGTISFPDRSGAKHPELAQTELFATEAANGAC